MVGLPCLTAQKLDRMMKRLAFSSGPSVRLSQHGCKMARFALVAPSFNGRTADSGSAYRGSNPWGAASLESATYLSKPLRNQTRTGRVKYRFGVDGRTGYGTLTAHLLRVKCAEAFGFCP